MKEKTNIDEKAIYDELKELITTIPRGGGYSIHEDKKRERRDELMQTLLSSGIGGTEISRKLNRSNSYVSQFSSSRNIKRKKDRKLKISKSTVLKKRSIAAGGKIIGTTLTSILNDMKDKDIMKQVEMVDVLVDSGFKEEEVIKKMEAPSVEEFQKIMSAVKELSKKYTIIRKKL